MRRTRSVALALVVLGASVSPCAAAQDTADFGRQRFQQGVALYDAHNDAAALDAFQSSLELLASPNTRLYIARCLAHLGRLTEAVNEYSRAVGEASERALHDARYAGTERAAREELRELSSRVGELRLNASNLPTGASVAVDGRGVPNAALGLVIVHEPGTARVEARAPGFVAFARSVEIVAGRESAVRIDFVPESLSSAPSGTMLATVAPGTEQTVPTAPPTSQQHPSSTPAARIAGGTLLALGALGVASTATFLTLMIIDYQNVLAACGPRPCPSNYQPDVSRGITYQTVTDVSIAVAALGLASGSLILWLARDRVATTTHRALIYPTPLGFGGQF
jgi:hypothetical protein